MSFSKIFTSLHVFYVDKCSVDIFLKLDLLHLCGNNSFETRVSLHQRFIRILENTLTDHIISSLDSF